MELTLHRATLARYRKIAGYSVPALARALDISADHLYRCEHGRSRPSPALYLRLKAALHVKDERLLAESHPEDETAGVA